jgi:hypothetical protein
MCLAFCSHLWRFQVEQQVRCDGWRRISALPVHPRFESELRDHPVSLGGERAPQHCCMFRFVVSRSDHSGQGVGVRTLVCRLLFIQDKVWHAHILDTTKYSDDCNRAFGHLLHHAPNYDDMPASGPAAGAVGEPGDSKSDKGAQQCAATIAMYEKIFGHKPPMMVWESLYSSDALEGEGGELATNNHRLLCVVAAQLLTSCICACFVACDRGESGEGRSSRDPGRLKGPLGSWRSCR